MVLRLAPADELANMIHLAGLPAPEREYRFHATRKWRADFAWPAHHLLTEVDGGGWINGRHHRPLGFQRDCEKLNAAALLGWLVFRFTPPMIRSGDAIRHLTAMLQNSGGGIRAIPMHNSSPPAASGGLPPCSTIGIVRPAIAHSNRTLPPPVPHTCAKGTT